MAQSRDNSTENDHESQATIALLVLGGLSGFFGGLAQVARCVGVHGCDGSGA